MKKSDIAIEIARETGVTESEAADQVDEAVTSILKKLKKGRPASFPGLGSLRRDLKRGLHFTPARTTHGKS